MKHSTAQISINCKRSMNVERDDDRVGFYPQTETEVRYSDRWDLPTRGGRNNNKIHDIRTQNFYIALSIFCLVCLLV